MAAQLQPIFYKLMHHGYVDRFLDGQVKFGTLDEYRGHKDRHARLEAISQTAALPKDSEMHFAFVEHLRKEGISYPQPAEQGIEDCWEGIDSYDLKPSEDGLSFGNVISTHLPNMAIFCGSHQLTPEVVRTMRAASIRHGGQRYDCCVPIIDLQGFFDSLTAALVEHLGINGPVTPRVDHVIYGPKRMPTSTPFAPRSSGPFRKLPRFRSQREFRYVLDYKLPDFVQGTAITMDKSIERFCREPIDLDEAFPESQDAHNAQ